MNLGHLQHSQLLGLQVKRNSVWALLGLSFARVRFCLMLRKPKTRQRWVFGLYSPQLKTSLRKYFNPCSPLCVMRYLYEVAFPDFHSYFKYLQYSQPGNGKNLCCCYTTHTFAKLSQVQKYVNFFKINLFFSQKNCNTLLLIIAEGPGYILS